MVSSLVSTMAVFALCSRSAPRGFAFPVFQRKNHRHWCNSFSLTSRSLLYQTASNWYEGTKATAATTTTTTTTTTTASLDDRGNEEHAAPRSKPNPKNRDQILRARTSLARLAAASRPGLDPSRNRFHAPLVYHDGYSAVPDWPPNHTFPMQKFERIAHALLTTTSKTVASSNLPRPLVRSPRDFFRPPEFSEIPIEEWLDLLNNASDDGEDTPDRSTAFGHRFLRGELTDEEARLIGFREQAHRPELVERTVLEVAGTVRTAQLALQHGIAANLAGGTHHAHPEGGAGYTILNDLAITTDLLTTASMTINDDDEDGNEDSVTAASMHPSPLFPRVDRVLVIDCDVHQGDGTARYSKLWETDRRLFTLSLHCESNYPFRKHNSTYDVGLPDHCNDEDYLSALRDSVETALEEVRPDLVLYDAGVDVYEHDKLGRLDLSEEGGIRRRDRWVLDRCASVGIPVAAVVGGGYDRDSIDALGRRHAIVHEECAYVWRKHKLWRRGSEPSSPSPTTLS